MKSSLLTTTLSLFIIALSSCTTGERQATGIAGGAVVGGIAGNALTGGSTAGTVVGAAVGGIVGNEIAK